MPINPDAVGTKSEPARRSWNSKDALLYALGVGAGASDPLDELEFTTENTSGKEQRALPTIAVVLGPLGGAFGAIGTFNPAMLVHGEQGITLHREIPVEGELEAVSEITGIYDKGKGAVVVTESKAVLVDSGEPLFDTRMSAYIRGEGGWGGDRGPSGNPNAAPERDPDESIQLQTRTDQALIYRLSGDRNPLHSDPAFAAMGGFDKPILHGLCTYGFTGRGLLHAMCGSDPARFKGMDARFSSPVMPGESLTVKMWNDGDGSAIFQTCGQDGRVVIDGGRLTYTA
jgi:acyl dehydratase